MITTIQEPTPSLRALHDRLTAAGAVLFVVGDSKGPDRCDLPGTRFLPLQDQLRLPFALAGTLPTGHYARKNLGYLVAIADGSDCLYETDDDNAPNTHWKRRSERVLAETAAPATWVNAYRFFTEDVIWPRGLPLERIHDPVELSGTGPRLVAAPLQQGLADHSPDVDAVWRLVFPRDFHFRQGPSVQLPPGSWCPFNSQSTWWWPAAWPLLYLPSCCSFRMTDIWRSFVAQRCLWELETGVVFHPPEVSQDRNAHSLQRDFEHEVPGYLHNERLVDALARLRLQRGSQAVSENLIRCYERLVQLDLFPDRELSLVRHWVSDVESAMACGRAAARPAVPATDRSPARAA